MKKSLLALAVAGAFAAPSAMALELTTSIYQSYAVSIGKSEVGAVSTDNNTIADGGGNTLGFKVTDDLGNGMSAEAFLHYTHRGSDMNNGLGMMRDGYIGLNGSFGSVKMGMNEHVYEVGSIIDGWGSDYNGGASVGGADGIPTLIGLTGFNFTRQDENSLWWTSPNFNGITVDAAYVFGPADTATDASKGYQLQVKWVGGPLMINGAMAAYKDYAASGMGMFTGQGTGTNDADAMRVTATYNFGMATIGGSVHKLKQDDNAGTEVEVMNLALTGILNVATGRIIANYVKSGEQDVNGTSISDSGATGYDVGYQHDLSKNTYGFLRYEANNGDANYKGAGAETKSTAIMVGLKVSY